MTDWLINLTPGGGRTRLLCLPYAGGGSSAFHEWPAALPPSVDVWTIRLPGRESRLLETPYTDLRELIDDLAPAVAGLTTVPYTVFGHSMGALIGYELIRALRARGRPEPTLFVASGHVAPHVADHSEQLHKLPHDRFVETLREYGGTPDALLAEPELLELFLPALRGDFAVVETYRYRDGIPLTCPITVFRGDADRGVGTEGCRAWNDLTSGATTHHGFPGGHFFIDESRARVLGTLADLLRGTGIQPEIAA
ncbi:alpha/beta fold hydrolase [Kibdelosporangium philippinense]|uniref:Alpha/beta fold hydrolase n=1 Tax=Kibdelosporangium philippinense TaxID=211113 RepID=A0ABS8Z8X9_9PSEU|nr:alpha/beta fold hydrolase [Kibdelosporangium philippinense]MCE7002307.1 alpha/beta fold hydrolase [Kibdelosporangium philippinense]